MKVKQNGRRGMQVYVGSSSLVTQAMKSIKKTNSTRQAAVDLVLAMGHTSAAEELSKYDDDMLRGLTVPVAKLLGLSHPQAVRLICKIRGVLENGKQKAKNLEESTYAELQQLAKQHGLKATGTAAQLRKRLAPHVKADDDI